MMEVEAGRVYRSVIAVEVSALFRSLSEQELFRSASDSSKGHTEQPAWNSQQGIALPDHRSTPSMTPRSLGAKTRS